MARIRSVHPGLATDEIFMSMSAFAKAAWPLLWTECDDQGVFEWKPVVLKARILPADHVEFRDILNEYLELGAVIRFEIAGRCYGAVRNFKRYQNPKKPNSIHPTTPESVIFVGSSRTSSVPVPNQSSTGPVKSPQREEGGGSKEEKPNGFFKRASERKKSDLDLIAERFDHG